MCPCQGHYVCPGCTADIKRLYRDLSWLEPQERGLSVAEYDRLRQIRGRLLRYGLKAEIVIHRIKTREWEEANT